MIPFVNYTHLYPFTYINEREADFTHSVSKKFEKMFLPE